MPQSMPAEGLGDRRVEAAAAAYRKSPVSRLRAVVIHDPVVHPADLLRLQDTLEAGLRPARKSQAHGEIAASADRDKSQDQILGKVHAVDDLVHDAVSAHRHQRHRLSRLSCRLPDTLIQIRSQLRRDSLGLAASAGQQDLVSDILFDQAALHALPDPIPFFSPRIRIDDECKHRLMSVSMRMIGFEQKKYIIQAVLMSVNIL